MLVATLGSFDLFHRGHVNLLRRCWKLAGEDAEVAVGLNTDAFIEAYKGRPPVINYSDRAAVLNACRYVSVVVPNVGGADAKPILGALRPDILAVGSDWQDRDYYAQLSVTPDWLRSRGISLVYLPYTTGISTTAIRSRMDR